MGEIERRTYTDDADAAKRAKPGRKKAMFPTSQIEAAARRLWLSKNIQSDAVTWSVACGHRLLPQMSHTIITRDLPG